MRSVPLRPRPSMRRGSEDAERHCSRSRVCRSRAPRSPGAAAKTAARRCSVRATRSTSSPWSRCSTRTPRAAAPTACGPRCSRRRPIASGSARSSAGAPGRPTTRASRRRFAKLAADGVTHVIFGDILFDEHRRWAERMCDAAGLTAVEPLWGSSTTTLFRRVGRVGRRRADRHDARRAPRRQLARPPLERRPAAAVRAARRRSLRRAR